MTAPARFKQQDVTRAVQGVIKAGMRVGRVEIDPNGRIIVLSESVAPVTERNPWDKDLPN